VTDAERSTAELIEDCVHCGFCLPTCPTYALWGEEMDSPRGRIVLMKGEPTDAKVTHLDNCLGCMACVTACPSGVRYDQLITRTRAGPEYDEHASPRDRALRAGAFALFTHPGRLRPLAALTGVAQRLGVPQRLGTVGRLAPRVSPRGAVRRLAPVTPARGASRGRAGLIQGCVQRAFFGDVNAATVRVLAREGWEVHAPARPRCCGALQYHEGDQPGASERAKETIAALEDCDVVVVNAAGCGSAVKEYDHLLAGEPAWAQRAAAFVAKVRDATELLAADEPRTPRRAIERRVAYHDACHLAHAQGIRDAPRRLLRSIPGLELVEPAEWELCCGSAGIYNLRRPKAAADLGRRKAANLQATGAELIAAANPGCTLQIQAYLERPLPIVHPVQLIDQATNGGPHP